MVRVRVCVRLVGGTTSLPESVDGATQWLDGAMMRLLRRTAQVFRAFSFLFLQYFIVHAHSLIHPFSSH